MTPWLIAFTGAIYGYIAIEQVVKFSNVPLAIMYLGYAIGNVGVYFLAVKST